MAVIRRSTPRTYSANGIYLCEVFLSDYAHGRAVCGPAIGMGLLGVVVIGVTTEFCGSGTRGRLDRILWSTAGRSVHEARADAPASEEGSCP
jgi:hypothetical protein